jgi:hypothetical protein
MVLDGVLRGRDKSWLTVSKIRELGLKFIPRCNPFTQRLVEGEKAGVTRIFFAIKTPHRRGNSIRRLQ